MDPNTTPTPNPMPTPAPAPGPAPVSPAPTPTPTPTPEPTPAPASATPAFDASVFESTPSSSISATDPITQPEPAPTPDPVEEALKAPMKPADPVPGSIGSAVSGNEPASTPNVSFNDPATEQPMMQPIQDTPVVAPKKKSNTGLIVLCIIAIVVVAALGIVLAMQLLGNNSSTSNNNSSVTPEVTPEPAPSTEVSLECKYVYTDEELANFGAASGTGIVTALYNEDALSSLSFDISLAYLDQDKATSGLETLKNNYIEQYTALGFTENPFVSTYDEIDGNVKVSHLAAADILDAKNIEIFGLKAAEDGTLDTSSATVKATYEALDFSCDSL